ncbi:MAG: hypothetical protein R2713_23005 [Ilumatobacteraceae bacterium]
MKHRLAGPGRVGGRRDRRHGIGAAGSEIIDSRYDDFSFTAADVAADNTSEAKVVMGPKMVDPAGLDLRADRAVAGGGRRAGGHCERRRHDGAPGRGGGDARPTSSGARGEAIEGGVDDLQRWAHRCRAARRRSPVTATFGHLGSVTVRGI